MSNLVNSDLDEDSSIEDYSCLPNVEFPGDLESPFVTTPIVATPTLQLNQLSTSTSNSSVYTTNTTNTTNTIIFDQNSNYPLEVCLPSIPQINREMTTLINQRLVYHLEQILKQLSHDHRLNYAQLKDQYLEPVQEVVQELIKEQQQSGKKVALDARVQCQATTSTGRQCSKNRTNESLYCGIHHAKSTTVSGVKERRRIDVKRRDRPVIRVYKKI